VTVWRPDISQSHGPKYLAIVEAIDADIAKGALATGTRLPTHRDLAWTLGVTVGTVSRAYAEAERRGLVAGHVGRGTFVQEPSGAMADKQLFVTEDDGPAGPVNFSFNYPVPGEEIAAIGPTLAALSSDPALGALIGYQSHAGLDRHREAGAVWLKRCGLEVDPSRIVITAGAHNAMMVAMTALTRPGGRIVTDELTYPGIQPLAHIFNAKLEPLAMDRDGIRPDALETACRQGEVQMLYTVPTLQNPTNIIMPSGRRAEIAAVARRYTVPILEDDIFGPLTEDTPPPICSLAPELGYYIGSIAKALAPGLRIAYMAGPAQATTELTRAVRVSCWMASPLTAEIAARWICEGTADRILESRRLEGERRRRFALSLFPEAEKDCPKGAMHIWLRLPEPWRSSDFVAEAKRRGVLVTPPEAFVVGRGIPPHAVRICLGPPRTWEQFEKGLRVLAELVRDRPVSAQDIV